MIHLRTAFTLHKHWFYLGNYVSFPNIITQAFFFFSVCLQIYDTHMSRMLGKNGAKIFKDDRKAKIRKRSTSRSVHTFVSIDLVTLISRLYRWLSRTLDWQRAIGKMPPWLWHMPEEQCKWKYNNEAARHARKHAQQKEQAESMRSKIKKSRKPPLHSNAVPLLLGE